MAKTILYNQDCIAAMQKIDAESVDLIVTDPPYNLGNFMKKRDTNLKKMRDNFFGSAGWDNMEFDEWSKSMDDFFKASARVMKKGGTMIMFMAIIKVETIIQLAEKHGFYYKTTGIWHKTNPMPRNMNLHFVNSTEAWVYFTYKKRTGTFNNGGAMFHDFIETSVTPNGERKYGKHPTQKPEGLIQHFVEILSNPKDTVLDAISDLAYLNSGEGEEAQSYRNEPQSEYQKKLRAGSTILHNHVATKHSPLALERLAMIPPNAGKEVLPEEHLTKSIYSGTWTRMRKDEISVTITTRFDTPSSGKFTHPFLDRAITVREAARIQSFPDSFQFVGNKGSQMKQVGNAVPPLLAGAIAKVIIPKEAGIHSQRCRARTVFGNGIHAQIHGREVFRKAVLLRYGFL